MVTPRPRPALTEAVPRESQAGQTSNTLGGDQLRGIMALSAATGVVESATSTAEKKRPATKRPSTASGKAVAQPNNKRGRGGGGGGLSWDVMRPMLWDKLNRRRVPPSEWSGETYTAHPSRAAAFDTSANQ